MPRKRKRGGKGGQPREQRSQDAVSRDLELTKLWPRFLAAAAKKKLKFTEMARKVDRAFENMRQEDLFDREDVAGLVDGAVACPVNLAFQVRGWLAPALYHRNPTRQVTPRTKDGVLKAMSKVVGKYLNYTPKETGLAEESRAGIDEALLAGRGVLYTGVDPETGLVTSWQVSIDDVLIDPDAKRVEDALWIAYRRRITVWQAKREFGAAADELDEGDHVSSLMRAAHELDVPFTKPEGDRDEEEDPVYTGGATNDLVTVWEVYSKMGSGFRGRGVDRELRGYDEGTDFRKIVIVPGYDRVLYEGPWEVPLYLDRRWPFNFLDLVRTRNKLWPVSLIGAAMPNQDGASLFATIAMAKGKEHARELYFVAKGLNPEDKDRIASGGLSEVIEVGGDEPNVDVRALVQRFPPGEVSPQIMEQLYFHLDQFGQITGLLPILKGLDGEQQVRSATEADIKDKNARSRLTDMSERVEDWHSQVARTEGILVRLELDADEVQRVLGEPGDTDLGFLIGLSAFGVEYPVRLRQPEPDEGGADERRVDLETLWPAAGTYFDSPDAALATAQELLANLAQLNNARLQSGEAPIFVDRAYVRPVTVADVWRDTAYLSPQDICRELSFSVESGSTKRQDPNKAIDNANTVMSIAGQPALAAGDVETYNRALVAVYESIQTPEDKRVFLRPPPAPMPPGAPPGGGGGEGGVEPQVVGPDAGFSFVGGPGGMNRPTIQPAGV